MRGIDVCLQEDIQWGVGTGVTLTLTDGTRMLREQQEKFNQIGVALIQIEVLGP